MTYDYKRRGTAKLFATLSPREHPLAFAAMGDKIVQREVVTVLNAIYEEDFLRLLLPLEMI